MFSAELRFLYRWIRADHPTWSKKQIRAAIHLSVCAGYLLMAVRPELGRVRVRI